MALVLTLIMLAIITIVVVVFLATTRRNRASVTVRKDQTDAEYAAETASQHAQGRVIERILRDQNLLSFEFFVSHPGGYIYETNNGVRAPLNSDEIPRVHNASNTVNTFLDLNRNRFFDDPDSDSRPFGDPIWLGVLDKPWFPHSRTNHFIARYAYLVQPVGKSLDLNTIHNATRDQDGYPDTRLDSAKLAFMRNQGFGPWELNLAAFLHELSPTDWDYNYDPTAASGNAFLDARQFLDYRNRAQGRGAFSFLSVADTYPSSLGPFTFPATSIDAYADGTNGVVLGRDISKLDDDFPTKPAWPGADPTNHFFTVQDYFRPDFVNLTAILKSGQNFNYLFDRHLTNAMTRLNANNETNGALYYRMLAQLGTQTGSDVHDKINLNYADEHAHIPGTNYYATNFVPWSATPELAVAFFTNVAERIFMTQSNDFNPVGTNSIPIRSILEIPVHPTNMYSSAIHRVLQEAANILSASGTNIYPPVFRPVFGSGPIPGVTYITNYIYDDQLSTLDAWLVNNTNSIPPVVGVKKGFPNFNEFTLRTVFLTTRKIQVERDSPPKIASLPSKTNLMYIIGISNAFWAESWNSYIRQYPRAVSLAVTNFTTAVLYNDRGFQYTNTLVSGNVTNFAQYKWPGRADTNSFVLSLSTNEIFLTNNVYNFASNVFASVGLNAFERQVGFPVPYWILTVSNRVEYRMFEGNRLLDCALLSDNFTVDINKELYDGDPYRNVNLTTISPALKRVWDTNLAPDTVPWGIKYQMDIALGNIGADVTDTEWKNFATFGNTGRTNSIQKFREWCGLAQPTSTNYSTPMQAGFNPGVKVAVTHSWQANDPLVHHHADDLRVGLFPTNTHHFLPYESVTTTDPGTIGYLNTSYSPWHGNRDKTEEDYNPNVYNLWLRDPGVFSSDDWHFPSNKIATVGLLGRVHRGSPWQTIYFKSGVTNADTWGLERPTFLTHPSNDWKLVDFFTTALDERTSSGLVSINQTNMEAWSAALSGVLVLANKDVAPVVPDKNAQHNALYNELFIPPWGNKLQTNAFTQIWQAIYRFQTDTNLGRPLRSVGELLQSVPELTTKSPFLNTTNEAQLKFGLDDFAYEQIPQQILSLLRVGQPRFVIYAYGQALRPQQVDAGTGHVINYQVTAEYATRTVVRIEGDPRTRLRAVVESFNILPPD